MFRKLLCKLNIHSDRRGTMHHRFISHRTDNRRGMIGQYVYYKKCKYCGRELHVGWSKTEKYQGEEQ